jgi:DNA-binding transcriptional LysR family regulator
MAIMNTVHIGALDLNLLAALDALLEERNVTRAAERLGVTQSAMSHSLARLRALTGDALLVRAGAAMVPTPRAAELAPPIRRALDEIARALAPPAAFDPRTASRKFVLASSDYLELVLLPRLVARLEREAPGIDLRSRRIGDDVVGDLASGAIDVAIMPMPERDQRPGVFARRLFDEKFVCVVRRGHPLAKKKMTLARYAATPHALIAPRGTELGTVDEALARLGMKRRVAVMVPHFLIAPHVVASSDLVLTLAARVADVLAKPLKLAVLAPPRELELPGFTMSAMWHERAQNDPGQKWMRALLADVAAST